jgi:DNA-directed RNA polymerase-3 subunit RPC5
MWRFTQSRCLVRKEISSVVKLPADDVKAILEQMASLRVNCGWEFLLEYDSEFVHRHPEVVQRQHMLWDAKFQQLSSVLPISKADLKIAANAAASAPVSPKRRRTTSTRSRTKSGGVSDDTDVEDGRRRRISSSSCDGRKRHGSSRQNSECNGEFAEPAPPEPAALDGALNDLVRDMLSHRCVMSMQEMRLEFNRHLAECPPGHVLGSGVSDKRIEQAVLGIGGFLFQVQTPQGEPIFGLLPAKDAYSPIRDVMVVMLNIKGQIKISKLKKGIEDAGLEIPEEAELRKLLKEMCYTKSGLWNLKGSAPGNS